MFNLFLGIVWQNSKHVMLWWLSAIVATVLQCASGKEFSILFFKVELLHIICNMHDIELHTFQINLLAGLGWLRQYGIF